MLVCILSNRPEAATHYASILQELGITESEVTNNIMDLFDLLTYRPVCGIALDIPAIVRASEQGKQLLNNISEIYPIVKLNWAPGKEIRAVGNRFLSTKEPPLESFILACRTFQPRTWRKYERLNKVVNLYWSAERATRNRAFTLDVSRGGCFVCTLEPPAINSIISLDLLTEERTVQARVTWVNKWGEMERAPGFGCEYLEET
jgi:hypothetical protein